MTAGGALPTWWTRLVAKYAAPREAIATDVIAMLQDLADKGFLTEAREKTS